MAGDGPKKKRSGLGPLTPRSALAVLQPTVVPPDDSPVSDSIPDPISEQDRAQDVLPLFGKSPAAPGPRAGTAPRRKRPPAPAAGTLLDIEKETPEQDWKSTSLRLPEEVFIKAKVHAAGSGVRLKYLYVEALRVYLDLADDLSVFSSYCQEKGISLRQGVKEALEAYRERS